jgi:hypothetical protein
VKKKGRESKSRKTITTLKRRVVKEAVPKPDVHGGSVPERSWPPEFVVKGRKPAKSRKR